MGRYVRTGRFGALCFAVWDVWLTGYQLSPGGGKVCDLGLLFLGQDFELLCGGGWVFGIYAVEF